MSVPRSVQKQIKAEVFRQADQHHYLEQDRTANGQFIGRLVQDESVGGKLLEYMQRESVRTYIKDALLNAYAKQRRAGSLHASPIVDVRGEFPDPVVEVEKHPSKLLWLYRTGDGSEVLVAGGTVLKWETALRKALDFIAASPGYRNTATHPLIFLRLTAGAGPVCASDKAHLESALAVVGVKFVVHRTDTRLLATDSQNRTHS
jgi:hypothetical protein